MKNRVHNFIIYWRKAKIENEQKQKESAVCVNELFCVFLPRKENPLPTFLLVLMINFSNKSMYANNYKDSIKFLIMIKMKIMMIPSMFDDVFIPTREREGQRGRTLIFLQIF